MLTAHSLEEIPPLPEPIGLTIGTFDGVHLGHQYLLSELKKKCSGGSLALLTFSNHPTQVVKSRPPLPLITTLEHKILLLEKVGVDFLLLLPFTYEFSQQPYDSFFQKLHRALPFSYLLLGSGASFGKERLGKEPEVRALAPTLNFQADYLQKKEETGTPLSSGRIRTLIQAGELGAAAALLGRPYSIYTAYNETSTHLPHLCLPPPGSYPITLLYQNQSHPAVAEIRDQTITLKGALRIPPQSMVELLF